MAMTLLSLASRSALAQEPSAVPATSAAAQDDSKAPAVWGDLGRPEVRWNNAGRVIGRTVFVSGRVIDVTTSGGVTFLQFDRSTPPQFQAIIRRDDLARFSASPAATYKDRLVRIRGIVHTFRGIPEIEIRDPAQITAIHVLPPERLPDRPKNDSPDRIRAASYNILNLFDEIDDPARFDETTPAKPLDQLERVAGAIRRLNADVLALQEVENREILERFVERFLPDLGYEVVLYEGNDVRGIDNALLTRVPVESITSYRHYEFPAPDGKPMRFRRDVLMVTLVPPGWKPFEFWIVHLQSNYEGRPYAEPVRLAEAQALRKLLNRRLAREGGARILVGGDFNDVWNSASTQAVVGSADAALHAFFNDVPEPDRITYNKEPYRSMIDFLLATPALAEDYVDKSYAIVLGSVESSGSDHNPVMAVFKKSQ